MALVSLSSRSIARTALLGIAATVALSACGSEPTGTLTERPAGIGTTPPSATSTASPTRTAAGAAPVSDTKSAPSTTSTSKAPASGVKRVSSDVSQLKSLGIALNEGVLIDVADDGLDRYLAVGAGGRLDFTGTANTDATMMSLKPAQVRKRTESTKNQVVIAPPFYNEDLGTGSCVADTARGELRLATCDSSDADQTWHVVPAGDSGQFELHGTHTQIRVNNGKITTGDDGYVGLQTIELTE